MPAKDIIDAAVRGAIDSVRKEPPNPCANPRDLPAPEPAIGLPPGSAPKPVLPTKPSAQSYT